MAAEKPTLALLGRGASSVGLPSDVPMLQVDVKQLDAGSIIGTLGNPGRD